MGNKSKKGLLMSLLWALVIITAVASSVAMTQSAKVATLRLEQTWTYDAPENVQVTFDAGEGFFSNSQHTYDTTIKIDTLSGTSIFPANPTRTGYTFGGYEYSVDGTNYSDYALASDMPFTDHLYARAKWTASSYSITYRDAGDTSFSGSHAPNYPISHTYGTATTLKTASKTGYSFGGWYTSSSCTGTAVTSLGATAYTNNITLYAKWSANNYSITYYDEGGSGFTGTHASGHPTSHSYGTATTLLNPTKDGYTFVGWYTNSSCTGDAVSSLGATTYTSNISLYAKWEEGAEYEITINFSNVIGGEYCDAFEIWEDSSEEAYYSMGEIYRPADSGKMIRDLTDEIRSNQITSESSISITTTAKVISILIWSDSMYIHEIMHCNICVDGFNSLDERGTSSTVGRSYRLEINQLTSEHTISVSRLEFRGP